MKNIFKLREAVSQFKSRELLDGRKILNKDLACELFPSDSPKSSSVTLYKYMGGKSFKLDPVSINRIANILGCTPSFLTGYKESSINLNNGNNGKQSSGTE